jgi:beta-lactamase class A
LKSWLDYVLSYDSPVDPQFQQYLEQVDRELKARYGLAAGQVTLGVLDLLGLRLALLEPDRIEYAASISKLAILLAYFQEHYQPGRPLPSIVLHELGLMIKASSNEMATKFSRPLGLKRIQEVVESYGFYDPNHGGGIWMGKHYGETTERIGDPVGDNSHAATARQLLRFYLLLEQGKLVSPEASQVMRDIFASPEIPHDSIKFVRGLAQRAVKIRRKWGSWEHWKHDSAVINGPGRHYIVVGLTHHPSGDEYLKDFAVAVDDWLQP